MYTINAFSELMKNQLTGKALSPDNKFTVVKDITNNPMIFAISEKSVEVNGKTSSRKALFLSMSVPGSPTGWNQIDLTESLGDDFEVHTFAVEQSPTGEITLALALGKPGEAKTSHFFIAINLPHDATRLTSDFVKSQLIEKVAPPSNAIITHIEIERPKDESFPLVVAESTLPKEASKGFQYYVVNADPTAKDDSWKAIPIPENVDRFTDFVIGHRPQQTGVYALYKAGNHTKLVFMGIPKKDQHGVSLAIDFKTPEDAHCVAVLQGNDGYSDLYVGGAGLDYFPSAEQTSDYGGYKVLTGEACGILTELLLHHWKEGSQSHLYGINTQENLIFSVKENEGDWSHPLVLKKNITQIAVGSVFENLPNHIYAMEGSGRVLHLYQDPQTTLWGEEEIVVHDTGAYVDFTSYTTTVQITDQDNLPVINLPLKPHVKMTLRTPSGRSPVMVNGTYHMLDEHPKEITTDAAGKITIVNRVEDISTIHYLLEIEGEQPFVINPAEKAQAKLKAVKSKDDLNLKSQLTGKDILDPSKATPQNKQSAAEALMKFNEVSMDLPQDGSLKGEYREIRAARLIERRNEETSQIWGLKYDGRVLTYYEDNAHLELMRTFASKGFPKRDLNDSVWSTMGDFLLKLEDKLKEGFHIAFQKVGEYWEILLEDGKRLLQAAFQSLQQVAKAIHSLLKETLGIDLEKFIDWLGFLFNWNEILITQKTIKEAVDIVMDVSIKMFTDKIRPLAQDFFEKNKDMLKNKTAIGALLGNNKSKMLQNRMVSTQKIPPDNTLPINSPQANWAANHLTSNYSYATLELPSLSSEIADMLQHLGSQNVTAIQPLIMNCFTFVKDNIGTLTVETFIDYIFDNVLLGMLQIAETISIAFMDVFVLAIKLFKTILTTRINIPILTYMYENYITAGSEDKQDKVFNVLNVVTLLAAIPTTVAIKIIDPSGNIMEEFKKSISEARVISQALEKLPLSVDSFRNDSLTSMGFTSSTASTFQPLPFVDSGSPSDALSGNLKSAYGFQIVSAILSTVGNILTSISLFILDPNDFSVPTSKLPFPTTGKTFLELFKFVFYFFSNIFNIVASILTFVDEWQKGKLSTTTFRCTLVLFLSQIIYCFLPLKDAILLANKTTEDPLLGESIEILLECAEVLYGVVDLIAKAIILGIYDNEEWTEEERLQYLYLHMAGWWAAFSSSFNNILNLNLYPMKTLVDAPEVSVPIYTAFAAVKILNLTANTATSWLTLYFEGKLNTILQLGALFSNRSNNSISAVY